jgi:membrane protein required for colicin V production
VNIVDVVIVALISLFAIRGYLRGLFREVFSLLGLFVGFVVAARYHEPVALFWQDSWQFSPILLQVVSFVSLFFIAYLILNLVGLSLHRSAHFLFLGGFNRLGGVLVGTGKAGLVLGLGLFAVISQQWVPQNMVSRVNDARLVRPLFEFGKEVFRFGQSMITPAPSQTVLRSKLQGSDKHRGTSFRQRL